MLKRTIRQKTEQGVGEEECSRQDGNSCSLRQVVTEGLNEMVAFR